MVTGMEPLHIDDERIALLMGGELDELAAQSMITPVADFTDRVMAAVVREPVPHPVRAFGSALAARRLGAVLASIRDAWRVALGGSTPMVFRAQALALALAVSIGSLALAGGATVGTIDLLNANQPPRPSSTVPQPSRLPASPIPSPSPTARPPTESTPTPEASETPEATANAGGSRLTTTATPGPTESDDHGGGSSGGVAHPSPTGTEDGGGSGGDSETPSPTPTGTDDHGGGDG